MRNLVRNQINLNFIKFYIIILLIEVDLRLDSDDQLFQVVNLEKGKKKGLGAFRESNSGPLAPKERIIPLGQMPNLQCLP